MSNWIEAGGKHQLPFMSAASRSLKGEREIECPRCDKSHLRIYFHVFNKNTGSGTIWVWCSYCRTTTHLPRVKPQGFIFPDPFAKLSLEDFAQLEQNETEGLLDRLDQLWHRGEIGYPKPTST
jgi:hypothetical protein